jgi:poly-gamma-glutamate synthesis protein (capsule biosynthesis protein)
LSDKRHSVQVAVNHGFAGDLNLLSAPPARSIHQACAIIQSTKQPGDVAVASIHWGDNWGYDIPSRQRELAHALIDEADIDVVFGHSSHHPKAFELYREKLILYGCGDLINDYEGISGYEAYRSDLALMYFPEIAADGKLKSLEMVPFQVRSMRLVRANAADATWLRDTLQQQCAELRIDLRVDLSGVARLRVDALHRQTRHEP